MIAMCRRACALALVAALSLLAASAAAQNMPQASQVNGMPLSTPDLAVGTVTVRVFRERIGNSVPNVKVTLEAPKGPREATTDAEGRAEFTGLTPGDAVRVHADVDGEALQSQNFNIAPEGGTRVALIAGIAAAGAREAAAAAEAAKQPARPGVVVLGNQSRVIIEFQDDKLTVFYILDIVNAARTPIDTGKPLVFDLPPTARSASILEGSSTLGSMRNDKLVVTGPFPPGSTSLQLAYQLPWSGTSVELTQAWPVAMDDVFVAVERIGGLTLSSPQITQQQEGQASGQAFLMGVGPRLNPDQPMTVTLAGLPNRSSLTGNVAIGLTAAILLIGAWAAFTARPVREAREDSLGARRESLFAELVGLERRQARHDEDPETYRERRGELLFELEQVTHEIERRGGPVTGGREGATA